MRTKKLDGLDGHALDGNILQRAITAVRGDRGQLGNDGSAVLVFNGTKYGVLSLQPGGRYDGDEELGPVGSPAPLNSSVRHCEHVGLREVEVGADLIVELIAGATGSLAERIASLNHEIFDDPVKDRSVVERRGGSDAGSGVLPLQLAGRETDKVLDRLRCMITKEVDLNGSESCVQGGDSGVLRHTLILAQHERPNLITSTASQCISWQDGD